MPNRPCSLVALALACALVACSDDGASVAGDTDGTDLADDTTQADIDATEPGDGGDTDVGDGDEPVWPPPVLTVEQALDAVDPFIGTGGLAWGVGGLTPAAQTPYGLVRLGPDTTNRGFHAEATHFGGYHVEDPDVRGFSHTHFVGTGVADYGNVRVLPVAEVPAEPGRHWEAMDKDAERASPGFYAVSLPGPDVGVELTAAPHSGVHRYSFAASGGGYLLVDLAASVTDDGVLASEVRVTADTIEGWVTYDGGYVGRTRPFTLWVSATVDPPAAEAWVWDDASVEPDAAEASGVATGAVLRIDGPGAVVLRVGLSVVDADQAAANRVAEVEGRSFDEVAAAARSAWGEKLARLRLGGVDADTATLLYTALYNVYRMPTRFDGVDGRYRGLDGEVHEADGFVYYTDLSLWDSFRTLHPWLALTDVPEQRHVLRSLMAMYADGGYFPRWPAALSYTSGMIGTSADIVFADSALKGVDGVDYEAAFDGLMLTAMGPVPAGAPFSGRDGIDEYMSLGYVTADRDNAVSKTLEYAWADWALAGLATYLGRTDEAAALRERGRSYQSLFNPDRDFFMPREADGTFTAGVRPADLYMGGGPFTEGTAWHWRFYAPQDPPDLVALFGGEEAFGEALEDFFALSGLGLAGDVNTSFPDRYYWHGNEPALHSVCLFQAVGRYDRLAYWTREIQTRLYGLGPDGLPGNDDGGTLSAWLLFHALGLYPIAGTVDYCLSTPLVPYAELDVGDGDVLVVEASGASVAARYVRSVSLDGVPVDGGWIQHDALLGGRLVFEMSEEP